MISPRAPTRSNGGPKQSGNPSLRNELDLLQHVAADRGGFGVHYGVLGRQSIAHGLNEFLHLQTRKGVTACGAGVLTDHAEALNHR